MADWVKNDFFEDSYLHMHGFKPQIDWLVYNRNKYDVKIKYNGKEAIISQEKLRNGDREVYLKYSGVTTKFENTYKAEIEANRLLKE